MYKRVFIFIALLLITQKIFAQSCVGTETFTVSPQATNGTYPAGTIVTFCYTTSAFNQLGSNWIHGFTITLGNGWITSSLTPITTPNSCDQSGSWSYYLSQVSLANNQTFGTGFYYDRDPTDGDPGNNYGDFDATGNCSWTLCFSVQVGNNSGSLAASVTATSDGTSGSWGNFSCGNGVPFQMCPGCTGTAGCNMTIAATSQNPICGVANGTATVTPTGATGAVTYLWSNGSTTRTINGLSAGSYSVTATNGSCIRTSSVTLTGSNPLSVTTNFSSSCNGACSGTASVIPNNGSSPYTYHWSNNSNSQNLSGLCAGSYTATVLDANGCTATSSVTVTQSTAILLSVTPTNVSCFGGNDGSAVANASQGTGSFTYLWNNTAAQTTSTAINLSAGTYRVSVTDANGCLATASTIITQPAQITLASTKSDVTCFGAGNGSASVVVSQGVSPYSYNWSNSQTTSSITNLSGGNYILTVTDANNCSQTTSVLINEPNAILLSVAPTNATCFGANDGLAIATASQGSGTFTFLWNDPANQTTGTATNLGVGNYLVTATDQNGCSATASASISQPPQITLSFITTDISCFGDITGSASVTPSAGVSPFSYLWSNSLNTSTISNIVAGNYSVTVTDNNNCVSTSSLTINGPTSPLAESYSSTPTDCPTASNGTAIINVTGGTPIYSFFWNTGATISSLSGLSSGNYSFTITDANGCILKDSLIIGSNVNDLGVYAGVDISIIKGNTVDLIAYPGSLGNPAYLWLPSDNFDNPYLQTAVAHPLVTTTYTVIVTDVNSGCKDSDQIVVNVLPSYFVFMPSAFSPNGDGKNDVIFPVSGDLITITEFKIYSRWGILMHDNMGPWDGKFRGVPQNIGSYVYYVVYRTMEGESRRIQGNITLIR